MTAFYKAKSPDGKHLRAKILLFGQVNSGKNEVFHRFVDDIDTNPPGILTSFKCKDLVLDNGAKIELIIWDTAGCERFHALAPLYYQDAHAAIVFYDITDQSSYEGAKNCVAQLQQKAAINIAIVLVGTKADLAEHRAIDSMEAKAYADGENLLFAEVSTKTGIGIQKMFKILAIRLSNKEVFESIAARYVSDDHNEARNHQKSAPIKQKVLEPRLSHSVSSSTTFFCPSL